MRSAKFLLEKVHSMQGTSSPSCGYAATHLISVLRAAAEQRLCSETRLRAQPFCNKGRLWTGTVFSIQVFAMPVFLSTRRSMGRLTDMDTSSAMGNDSQIRSSLPVRDKRYAAGSRATSCRRQEIKRL